MPTDNLSPPPAPSRVNYVLGRMLGANDFQADQDYHRAALARALLQLCGTGTVVGLNVSVPQAWQPDTPYGAFAFVYDAAQNVQVNTGKKGTSGAGPITFASAANGTVADGPNIVWTNFGQVISGGWRPSASYASPSAIVDTNSNVQILTAPAPFTTGTVLPVWNTAVGGTSLDGATSVSAWTCVGPSQLEIAVTSGLAIDRVGRMIEAPVTVCILLQLWLASQTVSDLTAAVHSGNLLVDVFATFAACTRGVTPCFATQDDYDATDAFAANRLLDSFAMQLILRIDSAPMLPKDPWLPSGAAPTGSVTADIAKALKQSLLLATTGASADSPFTSDGPTPAEIPPGLDPSSVFLARISIPATAAASPGNPPTFNLSAITIDNLSRLFLYPGSLVARSIGLASGAES